MYSLIFVNQQKVLCLKQFCKQCILFYSFLQYPKRLNNKTELHNIHKNMLVLNHLWWDVGSSSSSLRDEGGVYLLCSLCSRTSHKDLLMFKFGDCGGHGRPHPGVYQTTRIIYLFLCIGTLDPIWIALRGYITANSSNNQFYRCLSMPL